MCASTFCWRGVSPVASGGPSGSSVTLSLPCLLGGAIVLPFPAVCRPRLRVEVTVATFRPGFKQVFEGRVAARRANVAVWSPTATITAAGLPLVTKR
jgi:hypothetical protein